MRWDRALELGSCAGVGSERWSRKWTLESEVDAGVASGRWNWDRALELGSCAGVGIVRWSWDRALESEVDAGVGSRRWSWKSTLESEVGAGSTIRHGARLSELRVLANVRA
jgi:hypothetical protein